MVTIVSLVLATVNVILLYFASFAFYLTHFLASTREEEEEGQSTSSCASFSLSLFLVFVFFRSLCHLMLIGIRMRDRSLWLNQRAQMQQQHKFYKVMQALLMTLSLGFLAVGYSWLASPAAAQCVPLATPLVVGVLSYETLALLLPLLAVALLSSLFSLRSLSPFLPWIPLTSEAIVSEKLGLSPEDISRLPSSTYAAGQWEEDDRRCSICLGDVEPGEQVRTLQCKHHFHQDCLDVWLLKKPSCPLCITKVELSQDGSTRSSRLARGVRGRMQRLRASMSRTRRETSHSERREDSASSRQQHSISDPAPDDSTAVEVDEALEMV